MRCERGAALQVVGCGCRAQVRDDFSPGNEAGETAHYLNFRKLDKACGVVENGGKVIGPGHHRTRQSAAAGAALVKGKSRTIAWA